LKIVLLGPPGAGKGTQAGVLSHKYGIPHISTGNILRAAVKDGVGFGLKAKAFIEKGELVPDEIVTGLVADRLKMPDVKGGFILDGFPRTLKQASDLDTALEAGGMTLDLVLYFDTSEKVAVERLSGRRVCRVCGYNYHMKNIPPKKDGVCDRCGGGLFQRPDDNEATVRNRLKVYERLTEPLVAYYSRKGILKKVSGDLDVQELFGVLSRIFTDERLA
jgi:adenylate kinase